MTSPTKRALEARLLTRGAKSFGAVVSASTANLHRLGWLPGDDHVEVLRDIPYTARGGKQSVDVYLPRTRHRSTLQPFAVFVHGGGWVIGDRKMGALMGRHLASRGIPVVAPGYRQAPAASLPEQLDDLRLALRFIHGRTQSFGLDATRYAVIGESAGAHLAMRLLQELPDVPRPRAAVGFYGAYDLGLYRARASRLLDGFLRTLTRDGDLDALVRDHGAVRALPFADLPVLLVHGDADRFVSVRHSLLMKAELERQGLPVELRIYPGSGHGFTYQTLLNPHHTRDAFEALERFFREHVPSKVGPPADVALDV